jgi:ATP adenylyltransferase
VTGRIWAPWRAPYITGAASRAAGPRAKERRGRAAQACIFCDLPAQRRDRENLILRRGSRTFVMLNKYPYNNGHLLVSPFVHAPSLDDLPESTLRELVAEVRDAVRRVREVMKPDGLNIGMNLGRVAGAGFEDHVHFHVVPRWNGDTNFMTAVGEVRVISQHLEATRKILEPAFRTPRRGQPKKTKRRR